MKRLSSNGTNQSAFTTKSECDCSDENCTHTYTHMCEHIYIYAWCSHTYMNRYENRNTSTSHITASMTEKHKLEQYDEHAQVNMEMYIHQNKILTKNY